VSTGDRGGLPDGPASFELIPALDLRDGGVVRLRQGDFDKATSYEADPPEVVEAFAAAGARWVHVVDLDGARAGEPRQLDVVRRIAERGQGRIDIELGGGLRSAASVAGAFEAGVARVAVGTAALRDPAFARELVRRHGTTRVAASIDVRDGLALGEGWRDGAPALDPADAIMRLADAGVATFEVTAIDRDGLLGGPDLDLLGRLVALGSGHVIASGGVASLGDLRAVRELGCSGAIVGRALYEGRLDLATAIAELSGSASH
jgi:phosphoribosylformimino-5-aminoimidazole carboxamide ribotide isomerase